MQCVHFIIDTISLGIRAVYTASCVCSSTHSLKLKPKHACFIAFHYFKLFHGKISLNYIYFSRWKQFFFLNVFRNYKFLGRFSILVSTVFQGLIKQQQNLSNKDSEWGNPLCVSPSPFFSYPRQSISLLPGPFLLLFTGVRMKTDRSGLGPAN